MISDNQQNVNLILEKKRNNGNFMFKIKLVESSLHLYINLNICNKWEYIIYSLNSIKLDKIDNIKTIYNSIYKKDKLNINFIGWIDSYYPIVIEYDLENIIFDLNKNNEIIIYNNSESVFNELIKNKIEQIWLYENKNAQIIKNINTILVQKHNISFDFNNIPDQFCTGIITLNNKFVYNTPNSSINTEISKFIIEINNKKLEINTSDIDNIRYLFYKLFIDNYQVDKNYNINLYDNNNKLIQNGNLIPIIDVNYGEEYAKHIIKLIEIDEYIESLLHMEDSGKQVENERDNETYFKKLVNKNNKTESNSETYNQGDNLEKTFDQIFDGITDDTDNSLKLPKNDYINQCPQIVLDLYIKLQAYCETKKKQHWLAAKHNQEMDRMFIIPSIIISTLSGIAGFIASTEVPDVSGKIGLGITVGVLATITTLLQSFSNAYGFPAKAEAHQNSAEAYDQIITDLRFEIINPNENCNYSQFIKSIEKRISEIKQRCKYIIPDWIEQQYEDMKFNNINKAKQKLIYSELIELKSSRYLEEKKKEKDISKIDLSKIDLELGI